jgi:transposase
VDEHAKSPRLRQVDRSQLVPELPLEQLLEPDHPARDLWDYVCALDLTPLLDTIRALEGTPGRNATDPRILLALWMWALSDGVGSARRLHTLCQEHNVYRWLAGGVSLNYHTLASFRSRRGDILEQFLQTHVAALLQQGLIDLSCVAQDGLRTRASAGAGSFRREISIEECQNLVKQQLEQLRSQPEQDPDTLNRRQRAARLRHAQERAVRLAAAQQVAQQLAAQQAQRARLHPKEAEQRQSAKRPARASTTDPEARRMKMPDGGTRPGYNLQFCTTTDTGIIVGVQVTNQGSDGGLLGPMLNQVQESYGQKPKCALVDGGFSSKADVEWAHKNEIVVYTPLKNEAKDVEAGKDPSQPKAGDGPGMKALRVRMMTASAKELYKDRASTAEWVNAGMRGRGLYRLTVRGLQKVQGMAVLQALVHNVWQTLRLLRAKGEVWSWAGILRAEPA